MIKHVVMWRVMENFENRDKKSTCIFLKEELESMIGKIDGLRSMDVGINVNTTPAAYDLVLITEHSTLQDLQFYQEHPVHQAVASLVKSATTDRTVVDYAF